MRAEHTLPNGDTLIVREAKVVDAGSILQYLDVVCAETDYLSFGPGEFDLTLEEEMSYLERSREADNRLYIVATVDAAIVASLGYEGGHRPRTRHTGEFGVTVRKSHWGLGVGSLMMDTLIAWARAAPAVKKINLRVRVDNERALRLYEQKGFVVEGTVREDLFIDGT